MKETMNLSRCLDTSIATELLPVVQLQQNFANFQEWEHSVRFYLRFHKLLTFIENDQRDDHIIPTSEFHCSLFVYSLIWRSAEAVLCRADTSFVGMPSTKSKELKTKVYANREHNPKMLWETLRAYHVAISAPQPLGYSGW